MRELYLLLSPRLMGVKNNFSRSDKRSRKKVVIMASVGVVFWGLMFAISSRVLMYFQSVEIIGDILSHHLLAMILLTFFSLLIFSHIITALSNLYLSSDLELCHSSPASLEHIFVSRSIYTVIDSSWMVIIFGLPVMMAYAYVYSPGLGFYFAFMHMGIATIIIAAGIGIFFVMIMVNIFPAQRTRDIIMILTIFIVVALYMMFRFLRPERLVDPEAFFSIVQYLGALKAPDSPYLPTHWLTEVLWNNLTRTDARGVSFEIMLTWSTALALIYINIWIAGVIYFNGFSKSQEAKKRSRGGKKLLDLFIGLIKKPAGMDLGSILEKDIRTFFRDNTQWSQLLLLGALVVVYVYNFSVLPLDKSPIRIEFLQNEIAFLNMGLAGFVLSAVSVRFIFPAVSSEGAAYWIVRTSPISLKRFLWGKFAIYLIPMIILTETLVIWTNYLLDVSTFMMFLSSVTMFFVVFGIVALGIGFGAMYPNFHYQNISQVATGFGGLMYMIFSAIFIASVVVLEAGPVYILFMADLKGRTVSLSQWLFIIPSFIAVLILNIVAVYKPMTMGLKALRDYE